MAWPTSSRAPCARRRSAAASCRRLECLGSRRRAARARRRRLMGYYLDELEPGRVFRHAIRRTVTETDNVLFSTLTHNPAPLHLDHEYMRTQSEFGRPLVN